MSYNIRKGQIVKLGDVKLEVLSTPNMVSYFTERGQSFGWVKCKVVEDPNDKYGVGYVSEFNGDFLR